MVPAAGEEAPTKKSARGGTGPVGLVKPRLPFLAVVKTPGVLAVPLVTFVVTLGRLSTWTASGRSCPRLCAELVVPLGTLSVRSPSMMVLSIKSHAPLTLCTSYEVLITADDHKVNPNKSTAMASDTTATRKRKANEALAGVVDDAKIMNFLESIERGMRQDTAPAAAPAPLNAPPKPQADMRPQTTLQLCIVRACAGLRPSTSTLCAPTKMVDPTCWAGWTSRAQHSSLSGVRGLLGHYHTHSPFPAQAIRLAWIFLSSTHQYLAIMCVPLFDLRVRPRTTSGRQQ